MKRTALVLLSLSLTFSFNSTYADGHDVTTSKVKDNIYLIQGNGGNVGLFIGKDGTFLIDDKFAPMSDNILAAIKEVGGDAPKYLLNTHFHGDHAGGNENFGKQGSIIISHDNVRKRLEDGSFVAAFNMKTPPAKPAALPVVTFANNMHLHINNENINAIHVPNAHTDGDSIIHFKKANVIHAGDTFFNGFFPFIDTANGGTVKGVIAAAETLLELADDDTKIIPGHGALASVKELKSYKEMLISAEATLSDLKKQGLTAEQAVEKKPLAALDSTWGQGFLSTDKWITIVYPSI